MRTDGLAQILAPGLILCDHGPNVCIVRQLILMKHTAQQERGEPSHLDKYS